MLRLKLDSRKSFNFVRALPVQGRVYGGRGCLARGSKIIMNDGSLKKIEDVVVGDFCLGLTANQGKFWIYFVAKEMMYRVKQTSTQDYVVNGAHVLVLKKSKSCPFGQRRVVRFWKSSQTKRKISRLS